VDVLFSITQLLRLYYRRPLSLGHPRS
jgi:hypothetical protein